MSHDSDHGKRPESSYGYSKSNIRGKKRFPSKSKKFRPAAEKKEMDKVREIKPEWTEQAIYNFCKSRKFDPVEIDESLCKAFEFERVQHQPSNEQWHEVNSKKTRRAKKKQETQEKRVESTASRGRGHGRGGSVPGGRGGRSRRGGSAPGRGGSSRGRGGRTRGGGRGGKAMEPELTLDTSTDNLLSLSPVSSPISTPNLVARAPGIAAGTKSYASLARAHQQPVPVPTTLTLAPEPVVDPVEQQQILEIQQPEYNPVILEDVTVPTPDPIVENIQLEPQMQEPVPQEPEQPEPVESFSNLTLTEPTIISPIAPVSITESVAPIEQSPEVAVTSTNPSTTVDDQEELYGISRWQDFNSASRQRAPRYTSTQRVWREVKKSDKPAPAPVQNPTPVEPTPVPTSAPEPITVDEPSHVEMPILNVGGIVDFSDDPVILPRDITETTQFDTRIQFGNFGVDSLSHFSDFSPSVPAPNTKASVAPAPTPTVVAPVTAPVTAPAPAPVVPPSPVKQAPEPTQPAQDPFQPVTAQPREVDTPNSPEQQVVASPPSPAQPSPTQTSLHHRASPPPTSPDHHSTHRPQTPPYSQTMHTQPLNNFRPGNHGVMMAQPALIGGHPASQHQIPPQISGMSPTAMGASHNMPVGGQPMHMNQYASQQAPYNNPYNPQGMDLNVMNPDNSIPPSHSQAGNQYPMVSQPPFTGQEYDSYTHAYMNEQPHYYQSTPPPMQYMGSQQTLPYRHPKPRSGRNNRYRNGGNKNSAKDKEPKKYSGRDSPPNTSTGADSKQARNNQFNKTIFDRSYQNPATSPNYQQPSNSTSKPATTGYKPSYTKNSAPQNPSNLNLQHSYQLPVNQGATPYTAKPQGHSHPASHPSANMYQTGGPNPVKGQQYYQMPNKNVHNKNQQQPSQHVQQTQHAPQPVHFNAQPFNSHMGHMPQNIPPFMNPSYPQFAHQPVYAPQYHHPPYQMHYSYRYAQGTPQPPFSFAAPPVYSQHEQSQGQPAMENMGPKSPKDKPSTEQNPSKKQSKGAMPSNGSMMPLNAPLAGAGYSVDGSNLLHTHQSAQRGYSPNYSM